MGAYADKTYYMEEYKGKVIPEEELDKQLLQASMHIDILTFNRIQGIERLTDFQQEVVRVCCCRLAEFEYENADIIETALQSYSINGVSMAFGESWNVAIHNGVAMPKDIYTYLQTTGLCCRVLR